MQQIKSFEDACKALGIEAIVPDFSASPEHAKALTAHFKLVIIAQALNNNWKPDWNNNDEYKYFPWFDMEVTKENPSGFVLYNVYCHFTNTSVGSRLCFVSREVAQYAGTQFADLYKEYMTIAA